jgi:hypothetical protein
MLYIHEKGRITIRNHSFFTMNFSLKNTPMVFLPPCPTRPKCHFGKIDLDTTILTRSFWLVFLIKPSWQYNRRKRAFCNQLVFNYMSFPSLFRLQNNIYLKKFHMDGWHLKWVDLLTSLVSVQHWPLMGVNWTKIFLKIEYNLVEE